MSLVVAKQGARFKRERFRAKDFLERIRNKALLQYCKMYGFITTYTGLETYPYTQSLKYVLFL